MTVQFLIEVLIIFVVGIIISLLIIPLYWKFKLRKIKKNIPKDLDYKIKLYRIKSRLLDDERQKRFDDKDNKLAPNFTTIN